MPSTYEGPNRCELLIFISEYNHHHDTKYHISILNAGAPEAYMDAMHELIKNEMSSSESARQLKDITNELWRLRRKQLKRGPTSTLMDWAEISVAGKKLVEVAEKAIASCNASSAASVVQEPKTVDEDPTKKTVKQAFSFPGLEVPNQKSKESPSPQAPRPSPQREVRKSHLHASSLRLLKKRIQSPKPEEKYKRPHHKTTQQQMVGVSEDKKVQSPEIKAHHRRQRERRAQTRGPKEHERRLEYPDSKDIHKHQQQTTAHAQVAKVVWMEERRRQSPQAKDCPRHRQDKQPQPQTAAKPLVKIPQVLDSQAAVRFQKERPQSPEDKARRRRLVIQQKQIMAHLEAKRLHSEVRKM